MSTFALKDAYKTLGLPMGANHREIQKRFRKLAQQYHPDKFDGDKETFQQIVRAYELLTPAAAAASSSFPFSSFSSSSLSSSSSSSTSSSSSSSLSSSYAFERAEEEKQMVLSKQVNNPLSELLQFAHKNIFASMKMPYHQHHYHPHHTQQHDNEKSPIIPVIELTLEELFDRKVKTIPVSVKGPCDCRQVANCHNCKASGYVSQTSGTTSMGPGIVAMAVTSSPCTVCEGTGHLIAVLPSCEKCLGKGVCDKKVEHTLIPDPSFRDAQVVTLHSESKLMGVIRLKPDENFSVGPGGQLTCRIPLTLKESLLGCTKRLRHPNGQMMEFTHAELTGPVPAPMMFPEQGLWEDPYGVKRGNVLAEFYVEYPSKLSDQQRATLEAIF